MCSGAGPHNALLFNLMGTGSSEDGCISGEVKGIKSKCEVVVMQLCLCAH